MMVGKGAQAGLLAFLVLIIGFQCSVVADSSGNSTGNVTADQCDPGVQNLSVTSEDTITWPAPNISRLYPETITAGMPTFTLTVDGNYFIPESRVLWDWKERTLQYHSPYQITAQILASDITTPGLHYVIVENPSPCGGNSNIVIFPIRDDGQTFPLTTDPLNARILKGDITNGSFQVRTLPDGLDQLNITLYSEESAPFTFFFAELPSWVTNPGISWLDENHLQIRGSDGNNHISNESSNVTLASVTLFGSQNGTSSLHCVLNEATGDSGSPYGSGYTALPVEIKQILSFPDSTGGIFPPPEDLNGDGLYEDINGNDHLDFNDIVVYFKNLAFINENQPVWAFDFDRNSHCNLNDVVALFHLTLNES